MTPATAPVTDTAAQAAERPAGNGKESAAKASAGPGGGPPSTCRVVRPGADVIGKQALTYRPGISAESTGARGIHLQTVAMPPGARARAHLHEGHETALHVLSGVAGMWYGPRLEHHMWTREGDYVYIPAGVPHLPYNASRTEPVVAVIARTDPNEQESVVLRPDLDAVRPESDDPMT